MSINTVEQKFKLSPQWIVSQSGRSLILTGGADSKYEIELDSKDPSFFSSTKSTTSFTRSVLSAQDKRVLEELLIAEIVLPLITKNKTITTALLGDECGLKLDNTATNKDADILVLVRSTSTFAQLLEKTNYPIITKPHLFIDLAYHHTVSFGPLVFPGETACIACLQGRVSTRWGDEIPPKKPRASIAYKGVAEELLRSELMRIQNDDTSLTNKTVSWNFQDRMTKTNQLLKVPLCPICNKNIIDPDGTLPLPWDKHENP